MNTIAVILTLLQNNPLTNILLTGFLFNDGTYSNCEVFVPHLKLIYLEFGKQFLRCESIDEGDQLSMSIVEKMENDPIIEQESDFELCVCSVSELYLKYIYDENRVSHLVGYLDSESRIEEGVVKAAEFQLGESGIVFLDPFNLFGIRIGTEQQRDEWLRMRSDTTNITREVFLVEGSRA